MEVGKTIVGLFVPHSGNNHKAKILHTPSIFALTLLVLSLQVLINKLPTIGVKVLGYASNISVNDVVRLTNEKRASAGLSTLTLNDSLSRAAYAKGQDMLAKDYWAHVAPDGTEPWKFFKDAGYKYKYAGENLARDFTNAPSAVDAWMASSSHRENILSSRYSEIGIAVVEGDLGGVDTTIIVQLFGTRADSIPSVPVAKASDSNTTLVKKEESTKPQVVAKEEPKQEEQTLPITSISNEKLSLATNTPGVVVSPFNTVRGITLVVVGIMLLVLVVDGVIVSRKRIARIAGRTGAHVAFFGMILTIILILKAGRII